MTAPLPRKMGLVLEQERHAWHVALSHAVTEATLLALPTATNPDLALRTVFAGLLTDAAVIGVLNRAHRWRMARDETHYDRRKS